MISVCNDIFRKEKEKLGYKTSEYAHSHIHATRTLIKEYFYLASKFPGHFHRFRILLVINVNNCFILLQSRPITE